MESLELLTWNKKVTDRSMYCHKQLAERVSESSILSHKSSSMGYSKVNQVFSKAYIIAKC